MKNILRLLLILALLIAPLACATTKTVEKEEEATQIQEREEASTWDIFKFVGAVCLVGLTYSAEPKEKYIVRDVKDGVPVEPPVQIIEKREK